MVEGRFAAVRIVEPSLPGAELVSVGLEDLRRSEASIEALVVSMAATRLRELGFDVPDAIPDAEHALWARLAEDGEDSAHSRYNALVRRLVSFQRAACVS